MSGFDAPPLPFRHRSMNGSGLIQGAFGATVVLSKRHVSTHFRRRPEHAWFGKCQGSAIKKMLTANPLSPPNIDYN
jgi:hypothetical protein